MDSIKPSSPSNKTKLARTIAKVIHLQTVTRVLASNNRIRKLKSQDKGQELSTTTTHDHNDGTKVQHRAAMEALIAKLFAGVSSVKAAYAELQIAQSPYNSEAIQLADEAVVNELKALYELKQSFAKKQIHLSPQVTFLLAEIQEQQSFMKTYEITVKKLESQIRLKDSNVSSLKSQLQECNLNNKCMEKRLNASGPLPVLHNVKLSVVNTSHFATLLHYSVKSIRGVVKLMMREMVSARWNLEAAANAIEPHVEFAKPSHICFAFESFVCREMFDGFNYPNFSLLNNEFLNRDEGRRSLFFERFKRLKPVNPIQFLGQNQRSTFGKFCRVKYLRLMHPKMEASFYGGNLNQRNLVNSGEFPDTAFFTAFAEMAKRVWLLHCLAFSFDQEVTVFQVRKECRFSEVFMESVTDDVFSSSSGDATASDCDLRVAFTVVPGFKIGKTAIQCQVYLSPANC